MSSLANDGTLDPGTGRMAGAPVRLAVFAAGGALALAALEALAAAHQVVVVVRPGSSPQRDALWRRGARLARRAVGLAPEDSVTAWARRAGCPMLTWTPGDEAAAAAGIAAHSPVLGCIATFPRRIPAPILAVAGRACLNLHPSLLPRHRGRDPLFWTYHAGDPQGGVSVHLVTDRLDAGALLCQRAFAIARGEPVTDVHERCAQLGGPLLAGAVGDLASGTAMPREQDEAAATVAPAIHPDRPYSRLVEWSCAHAWHFLAGLSPRYRDPLTDVAGRPVRYGRVEGYEERAPRSAPGTVVRSSSGWSAWTHDGVVFLSEGAAR